MLYVSMDIETTGLDPFCHQILEIGAVIDDLSNPNGYTGNPFHCYVIHDPIIGHPYTLNINREIIATIAHRDSFPNELFLRPIYIVEAFMSWLKVEGILKESKITFAGKNFATFDKLFLEKLPNWKDVPMGHHFLDPSSLYLDPKNDKQPPSLEICAKRAGLSMAATHRAVDDARLVVEVLRRHYL